MKEVRLASWLSFASGQKGISDEVVGKCRTVVNVLNLGNVTKIEIAEWHTDSWFFLVKQNASASVQKFYLREVNVTLLSYQNGSGK